MKHYKNYIFDLYGTLIDIETNENSPALWKKMAGFYSVYGADYRPAELKRAYLSMVKEEEAALAKETGYEYPEIELEKVFARLYLEAPHAHEAVLSPGKNELKAFSAYIANAFRIISRKKCRAYKNTEKVLKVLKSRGCCIYLLSNAQYVFTMPEMENAGLVSFFDGIYISSEHRVRKPDTHFMLALLDEYSLDKNDCVMVGNDYDSDIGIAASVGMDSIFINTFELDDTEKNKRLLAMRNRVGISDYSPVLTVDDIGDII